MSAVEADLPGPQVQRVPVRAEADGTAVTLDVSVYGQSDGARHPAVLLAHGFGGSKASVAGQAQQLQQRGYVVVTWSARGHGASGGLIHLDAPDYEVADARSLLDLAAARSDVELDGSGDPRAGVMGGSYGGALGLMLAGADKRVDAVVSAITWNDLSTAFFPQSALASTPTTAAGRPAVATPGPFKQVWATTFFLSARGGGAAGGVGGGTTSGSGADAGGGATAPDVTPAPSGSAAPSATPSTTPSTAPTTARSSAAAAQADSCGRFDPTICRLFLQTSESGEAGDEIVSVLKRHSPAPTLSQVTAPTMLVQGIGDSLFGLDQADATARALQASGTPYAVRWSDGGHDAPSTHEAEETEASYAWLDHWVRDKAPRDAPLPGAAFTYPLPASRPGQPSTLHTLPSYPGLGTALDTRELAFATDRGALVHPPGGQPASLIAVPGLAALGISLSTYQIAALPGQSAALDTEPLAEAATVVGSPTMRVTVTSDTPDVTLFASVWTVTGGGVTLTEPLVAPLRVTVTPGRPTPVLLSLPGATYDLPAGTRWRVLLTSTESTFSNSREPSQILLSDAGGLTLPVARGTSVGSSVGVAGVDTETTIAASALGALLLVALGGWLLRRRRRRLEPARPDLADVPLVVEGLVKTYADGHRAVDDVTWRAEKGQVVGLLGPNGAGKTTTMRMVMGLIGSDSGSVHVLGQPVTAGSPVLARVGALIEGPGFLPHLTGKANLEAYWAATGRAPEDAHFDEALDVAALGGAVDRPVKSYSQGMRQRLGIAQAMLGLPELLILDEPTNGLDPPQIAAMRPILRRYAESGRTVVVSSHLLAEVEMTCTHVVVMHAGRVVTQGQVADLVDSDDTTVLDLPEQLDPTTVREGVRVLAGTDGITDVRTDTPSRLVVVADVARADVVRAAVAAGLPVIGVSSRRHLEEVFLGVISSASGAGDGTDDDGSGESLVERLRQVRAR
ncbi:alpha/beta fold hydrolase [Terracoccus luteus]|uniref:ABC-2 type transport system ATP-binding protein n=1 Tax=Terracoccus luteus TaxID=53356 RepID=A0A839PWX2_9MICO|nr:alpha/beta fold hydrolase [Terracoccus luteus]MBB2986486.1 ABC-2 type transport system ATP-binding protein [Terracoccus luteus]MCP2171925.1 ABC-2 type transport system ATP-binding protein [Terracoccus luteus]